VMTRNIFCPICGAKVSVPAEGIIPETYILPDHEPLAPVNLCQGVAVLVTLNWAKCNMCGCNISKHPSGLCMACFWRAETIRKELAGAGS
jgi:NMD protein affecting ribosome stability and mRNA decay